MGDRLLNGAILGRILPQRQDSPLSSCSGGKCGLSPKMIASGVNNHTPHTITPPPEAAVQNIVSSVTQGAVPNSTTVTANLVTTNKADTKGVVKLDNGVHARIVNGEIRVTIDLSKAEAKGTLESFRSGGGVLRTGTTDSLARMIDSSVGGVKLQKSMHENNPEKPFLNVFAAKHLEKLELNFQASDGSTRKIEITRDDILAAEKNKSSGGSETPTAAPGATAASSTSSSSPTPATKTSTPGASGAVDSVIVPATKAESPTKAAELSPADINYNPRLSGYVKELQSLLEVKSGIFSNTPKEPLFEVKLDELLKYHPSLEDRAKLVEGFGTAKLGETLHEVSSFKDVFDKIASPLPKSDLDRLKRAVEHLNEEFHKYFTGYDSTRIKQAFSTLDSLPKGAESMAAVYWSKIRNDGSYVKAESYEDMKAKLKSKIGSPEVSAEKKDVQNVIGAPAASLDKPSSPSPALDKETSKAFEDLAKHLEIDTSKGRGDGAAIGDFKMAKEGLANLEREGRLNQFLTANPNILQSLSKDCPSYMREPLVKSALSTDDFKAVQNVYSRSKQLFWLSDSNKTELAQVLGQYDSNPEFKAKMDLAWEILYKNRAGGKSFADQIRSLIGESGEGAAVATSAAPATSSTPARTEAATTPAIKARTAEAPVAKESTEATTRRPHRRVSDEEQAVNKGLMDNLRKLQADIANSDPQNSKALEKHKHLQTQMFIMRANNFELDKILDLVKDIKDKDPNWTTRSWATTAAGIENNIAALKKFELLASNEKKLLQELEKRGDKLEQGGRVADAKKLKDELSTISSELSEERWRAEKRLKWHLRELADQLGKEGHSRESSELKGIVDSEDGIFSHAKLDQITEILNRVNAR